MTMPDLPLPLEKLTQIAQVIIKSTSVEEVEQAWSDFRTEFPPPTILRLLTLVAQLQAQLAHRDAHVEADDALRLHLEETLARQREALERIAALSTQPSRAPDDYGLIARHALALEPETP